MITTMDANVYGLNGEVTGTIDLGEIFDTVLRHDLIQRAVVSELSKTFQPQGRDPLAGLRTSADYFANRQRSFRVTVGRAISRKPREKLAKGGLGRVRRVPESVGGRAAHPPEVNKVLTKKINKKEYNFALYSAIANSKFVVVSDDVENLKKTKEIAGFINLLKEKNIVGDKKILFVVYDNYVAAGNIDFINVKRLSDLRVKDFVIGPCKLITSVLWTKKAIENLKTKI
ncbi:MAG: 50S ribosomal protein L4 [Candidatus Altarchaeum sp. CG03_land_8_20_14_0_80_32_618]|nr:MAG: 50S ribosomal protein L4 [Candidatus Altarchaeum sp. CG2_30_32_3053]PIV28223.1 MAG: 50S ribosomal protein L4 [Candidatus Altarchaeum sp. CG03_land_8_20_14_0_80_32_618]PIX48659.1 MAG: 50S ribosomal protein L4 [Candidatus Altarchaeum sp. CG_4_8_14_3_um_filter_33_2054]PIZ30824.1 MAG: 50S ribosomal protein L4 [Candidatus Altarchaeum sp. CG_4_10_14_0_8_um_filter_32_851]PJC15173.1 MAG: 50S ribosomal protein L4 [Candidatus Altarchaeum sp. CG_4_9_14_0_8_um_filter_32_206]